MEKKNMNIYERLSAITNAITNVAKNLSVGVGKSSYKAVGEADVLAAVKPLEAEYRVYSYPFDREIIESGTIESTNYQGEPKKSLFERVKVTYRFVNMDNPSEYLDIVSYGDGIDTGDKSVGKAMTYADKYALLKAYKIITGDDPDQDPSEELKASDTKKSYQRQAGQAAFEAQKPTSKVFATAKQVGMIEGLLRRKGKTKEDLKVPDLRAMSMEQASRCIDYLNGFRDLDAPQNVLDAPSEPTGGPDGGVIDDLPF